MLRRLFLSVLFYQVLAQCGPAYALTDESNIRQMRALAVANSARGDIEGALNSFDSAIQLAEHSYGQDSMFVAEVYFDAGLTALRADRYQRAEQCLTKAVQLNPNSIQARLVLAECYKKRGQMAAAKRQVRTVLEKHPNCLEARRLLALMYQQEGNLAQATQECYLLTQAIRGKEMVIPKLALAPPPVVAAPAPEPIIVNPIRPSAIPAKPKPVAAIVEPKKPEAKKPEPKKLEPRKPSKAELRKNAERKAAEVAKATKKKQDSKKRSKPKVEAVAADSSWGLEPRLKSKAVLLTPIKGVKGKSAESEKAETAKPTELKGKVDPTAVTKVDVKPVTKVAEDESTTEEEGFGGSTSAARATVKAKPVVVVKPQPAPRAVMVKAPPRGLVPPPPPVVPTFTQPFIPAPPTMAPPAARPKPKAVEKPAEAVVPDNRHPTEEDSDFLLEWGGKNKKKGK